MCTNKDANGSGDHGGKAGQEGDDDNKKLTWSESGHMLQHSKAISQTTFT